MHQSRNEKRQYVLTFLCPPSLNAQAVPTRANGPGIGPCIVTKMHDAATTSAKETPTSLPLMFYEEKEIMVIILKCACHEEV